MDTFVLFPITKNAVIRSDKSEKLPKFELMTRCYVISGIVMNLITCSKKELSS